MPKLVLLSTAVIWDSDTGKPYPKVAEALKSLRQSENHSIFLVSNKPKPTWIKDDLEFIKYQPVASRQDGKIVQALIRANEKKGLKHSQIVVLGAKDEDFQMAVNSKSLFIRCEWASQLSDRIKKYGVGIKKPEAVPILMKLLSDNAPWYFVYKSKGLDVFALTNAGTLGKTKADLVKLIEQLRKCLKNGDTTQFKAFQLHFLSSLYATDIFETIDHWGFYPSSASSNDESETVASFAFLARTMYKKRSKGPLFVRHKKTAKRHIEGGDRTDPKSQIESIHINPAYRSTLANSTVAVIDDYNTYGVSFGVSAALLQRAGVAKVICVAIGKFGRKDFSYPIQIKSDPFAPITEFSFQSTGALSPVSYNERAETEFLRKFT